MPKFKNWREVSHQWGGGTSFLFTGAHAAHDLCIALPSALIALIRAGLGLSYLQSGLVITAYSVTMGFSQLLGGWLGDRVSRHISAVIGLGGVGLTAMAIGLTNSYYPMLIVLVFLGIMAGAYHPAGTSLLSDYYEPARRGSVMGIHLFGGVVGLTITPVVGGLIANTLGWRFPFVLLGIPAVVMVPVILYWFRQPERVRRIQRITQASSAGDGAPAKPANRWGSIGKALRPVATPITLAILTQLIGGKVQTFIPLYLVDKHGIPPAYATMWLGAILGGGLAGSLLGGWFADKWGRKKVIFLGIVALGPLSYLLTLLPFNAGLIIIFALFGISMYMRRSAEQTILMDATPPQFRATVVALYYGITMEGNSILVPVVGWLMDVFGIIKIYWGIALLLVALSVTALILAKSFDIRR